MATTRTSMTRGIRLTAASIGVALAVAALAPLSAQRREPQTMATVLPPGQATMVGDIKILQVRNNVYALYGAGANITALIFPEGITLVDSGTDASADKVLAALKTLTD